jgi:hypothetical protein
VIEMTEMTETYTTEDFIEATGGAKFVGYVPGATEYSQTYTSGSSEEFERFKHLARNLLAVPKEEADQADPPQ